MLLSLNAFTTLSDEIKYSLLQTQQEEIYYLRRTVTDLTECLKKSTTPSKILEADGVSNSSGDAFLGNFRKSFIRGSIKTGTATSSRTKAASSGQLTTYAEQFKDSSNKVHPTQNASAIDA